MASPPPLSSTHCPSGPGGVTVPLPAPVPTGQCVHIPRPAQRSQGSRRAHPGLGQYRSWPSSGMNAAQGHSGARTQGGLRRPAGSTGLHRGPWPPRGAAPSQGTGQTWCPSRLRTCRAAGPHSAQPPASLAIPKLRQGPEGSRMGSPLRTWPSLGQHPLKGAVGPVVQQDTVRRGPPGSWRLWSSWAVPVCGGEAEGRL